MGMDPVAFVNAHIESMRANLMNDGVSLSQSIHGQNAHNGHGPRHALGGSLQNAIDLTDDVDIEVEEKNENNENVEPAFVPWRDEEIPHRFKCPISLEIMKDPVCSLCFSQSLSSHNIPSSL